jgi:hypothetical protein
VRAPAKKLKNHKNQNTKNSETHVFSLWPLKLKDFYVILSGSRTNKQPNNRIMNSTLTKQVAAGRIQMWWRECGGRKCGCGREAMGGDWPVGWEHLADLCVNCTPVVDPDTGDLEYTAMRPDSVPISERDSDPYMVGDWVAQRFRLRGEPRSDSDLAYSSDGSCDS